MTELTVPWEEGIEAAYERKKEKYNKVAAACTEAGWKASTYPVVVACILHWKVPTTIPEGSWNYQAQAEEAELLDLAQEKKPKVGKRIVRQATGGGRETSVLLPHHSEMFWDQRSETSVISD